MTWSVIIPSARPDNLISCVKSVLRAHPELEAHRVVVVDDGARAGAENELPQGISWVDGRKPFVFARNVNLGASACSPSDIIILGDDSRILTPKCFDKLAQFSREHPEFGIVSAGIKGFVGNPRQMPLDSSYAKQAELLNFPLNERPSKSEEPEACPLPKTSPQPIPYRTEKQSLAFICVMIQRGIWDRIGSLDEQFTGYGCEDVDYCWRVRKAGLELGIYYESLVEHGVMPSTFRTRKDFKSIYAKNSALLEQKWHRSS